MPRAKCRTISRTKTRLEHSEALSDKHLIALRKKKFGIYYRFPMFLRCQLLFIYNYIFRLGFLDGREGYVYHWLYQRWYRTLVDAKILEAGDISEAV